jgi:hypothetical protein
LAHAKLAPSSISRVIRCPGSAIPNAEAPSNPSFPAARGTAIHEMCEQLLKDRLDNITLSDYWLGKTVELEGFAIEIGLEEIMIAETYVNYIRQRTEELNGKLLIEEKLYLTEISEDCWGTADAVILGEGNRMVVADLKSGNYPVNVSKSSPIGTYINEQLLTYSLGALNRWGNENTVIEMTIIQPSKRSFHKDGPIRSFDIQALDLVDWGFNILKPACEEALGENPSFHAYASLDESVKEHTEDWCRFCAYKPDCLTFQKHQEGEK